MTPELNTKYQTLQNLLRSWSRVMVAYSGGVDSVFLLKAAVDTLGPERVLACLGLSESLATRERTEAETIARDLGAELLTIQTHELDLPAYAANPKDRCFHCKSELFSRMTALAEERGYDVVLCGANVDDLGDYRPGEQAGRQHGIKSPLQDAGLTKNDIRQLSKHLGLPTWDKPAQPCLASRMSYGLEITPERLRRIEQAEAFLKDLTGIRELRVRHHDQLARIEIPEDRIETLTDPAIRSQVVHYFKQIGFAYISLDLQGFRSGSANEILT